MKERIFIKKAKEHVKLEEFVRRQFAEAKVSDIVIQHTPVVTRIILYTTTPGLVIGSGGERIRETAEVLKKEYGLENPQIDVQRIENPDMDPTIVAQTIANSVEDGMNHKRLGEYFLQRIMDAGAVGCEIVMAGKFSGQRGKTQRFIAGYLKKCGEPAKRDVVKGFAVATPKLGNIGITVKIMVSMPEKIRIEKREIPVAEKQERQNDARSASGSLKKKKEEKGEGKAATAGEIVQEEKVTEELKVEEKEEGFEEKSDTYGHN